MTKNPQRPAASRGHGAVSEAKRASVMTGLLSGLSTDAAASAAGVDGSTVRKWLREDEAFRGEYEERIGLLKARESEALAAARVAALDTLAAAARGGDVQASIALLRTLPTKADLNISTTGDETAAKLAAAIEAAKRG